MHIRVLRSKLDALQERQLELGHSKAGMAELAVLESRVAELAGFVLPMQISAYDALRASDPSPVPVAAGMTQWRQGSQAERMQEKVRYHARDCVILWFSKRSIESSVSFHIALRPRIMYGGYL